MEYARWAPLYERIRTDLGFEWARERRAADRLRALLGASSREPARSVLAERLRGRDAVVVGLAPRAGPPPLWQWSAPGPRPAVVAADGAAAVLAPAGLVPEAVVTDLDGPVSAEIAAQAHGAAIVVHAHGDNLDALERWGPELSDSAIGTWAGPPEDGLDDFGGFSDGDRAAYLAEAFGARRILLWGFDFGTIAPNEPDPVRKRAKLGWARAALEHLDAAAPHRLFHWTPDGRVVPFGAVDAALR